MKPQLSVVFDINIWAAAILGPDSSYPYLAVVPPTSSNASADCLSLAFDGDRFKVFASPHVLKNLFRVLTKAGLSESLAKRALQDASDIVHFSGGSILEPLREAVYQKDPEDNLILDLTLASGSEVIVTLDQEFQSASGFKGIAIIPPKQFLNFAIRVQPD